jgi:hypothetical protein
VKLVLYPIIQRQALIREVHRQGCNDLGVHGATAPRGNLREVLSHPFGQANDELIGTASNPR